jgi:predicted nucleic acid-binding protein
VKVLLDSCVISYWLRGEAQFKSSIELLLHDVAKHRGAFFASAVTVQEIEAGARLAGNLDQWRAFMNEQCLVLDFTEACARRAAELAAAAGRPQRKGRSKTAAFDQWHRDAAIAATANVHGLDALATANHSDFAGFQEHLAPCALRWIA